MASYIETFASKLDWAMPFQRTGTFPLDRTSMFDSYADAVKYAKGNIGDPDKRELCGTSYIGQVISVYENDTVKVYKIAADRSLSEVGTATEGDNKSIILSDGLLSLYGFADATEGQQCRIKNIGSPEEPNLVLEWYTPDSSTVDGLRDKVQQLETNINTINDTSETPGSIDYKIAENNKNYYNKSEIDGKITGALHYKGTYESFAALEAAVADGSVTPVVGDVYNITNSGGVDSHGTEIKAGDNVICSSFDPGDGTPTATWDVSSGTIDLSNYYDKGTIDSKLKQKVDKAEGQRLMTDEEGTKLSGLVKVEKSETNGNIKLDGSETTVYTLPTANDTTIGGVKSTTDTVDKIKVEADGSMTIHQVSGSKVNGAVGEASKVTNALTIGGKTFDGSAPVEVGSEDIPLPENIVTEDEIATEAKVGVVKASAEKDAVNVDPDGKMTLNQVSGSKVKGAVGEASKVTNALTFGSKTFDGSEPQTLTAEDIGAATTADMEQYVKFTDVATAEKTGTVKSTTDTVDKIKVEADGSMTIHQVSGSKVNGAVGNANALGGVAATDILSPVSPEDPTLTAKVKSAATADKLTTARDVTLTGDATGTASFDGSTNVEIAVTLPDTNTSGAGTFTKVTVDAKGRVTEGENLTASDIPTLTMDKISDAGTLAKKNEVAETDLDDALTGKLTGLTDAQHTHTNKTVIDGITSEKVTSWDNTAAKIDSKANKSTTLKGYGITDAYTKEEVNGMVGGAFHYKGTYNTFAELQAAVADQTISTILVGDVYNIRTAGGEDAHGNQIKAGDNVVAQKVTPGEPDGAPTVEWDVLSGTVDLSAYYTSSQVDKKLATKADASTVSTISGKVDQLDTAVNDLETGLIKKVGDNTTAISGNSSKIANLESIVGKSTKEGLQKKVADNTKAIETLNGEEGTPGSVKQIVAASNAEIKKSITDITDVGTGIIDTRIKTHNDASDAHSTQFATKQNKAINKQITIEPDSFVTNENEEADGAPLKCAITVEGLTTGKSYSCNATPVMASCAIVQAAQFYPTVEMTDNVLSLFCVNKPSAAITISATFLEIH